MLTDQTQLDIFEKTQISTCIEVDKMLIPGVRHLVEDFNVVNRIEGGDATRDRDRQLPTQCETTKLRHQVFCCVDEHGPLCFDALITFSRLSPHLTCHTLCQLVIHTFFIISTKQLLTQLDDEKPESFPVGHVCCKHCLFTTEHEQFSCFPRTNRIKDGVSWFQRKLKE